MLLTDAELDSYRSEGYVVRRRCFDAAPLAAALLRTAVPGGSDGAGAAAAPPLETVQHLLAHELIAEPEPEPEPGAVLASLADWVVTTVAGVASPVCGGRPLWHSMLSLLAFISTHSRSESESESDPQVGAARNHPARIKVCVHLRLPCARVLQRKLIRRLGRVLLPARVHRQWDHPAALVCIHPAISPVTGHRCGCGMVAAISRELTDCFFVELRLRSEHSGSLMKAHVECDPLVRADIRE